MSAKYIYSNMANNITFVKYVKNDGGRTVNIPEKIIVVKGGAGITNKITLQVDSYVETIVTDDDFEFLLHHKSFLDFIDMGCMVASKKQLGADEIKDYLFGYDGCKAYTEETLKDRAKLEGIKDSFDIRTSSNARH